MNWFSRMVIIWTLAAGTFLFWLVWQHPENINKEVTAFTLGVIGLFTSVIMRVVLKGRKDGDD